MDITAVDPSVLVAQIGVVEVVGSGIIAGVFGLLMNRQSKKRDAEREADLEYRRQREDEEAAERAERQEKEKARKLFDAAKLDLMFATVNALDVALQAIHGDKMNGNVDEARESIKAAKAECNKLTNQNTVEHLN